MSPFGGIKSHVIAKTNQHVKYESSVVDSYADNERKHFYLSNVSLLILLFDPVDPKSMEFLFLPTPFSMLNIKALQ